MEKILLIAATAVLCLHLASCNTKEKREFVDLICIYDLTSSRPMQLHANAAALLSLYTFHDNPDKQAAFRLETITDRQRNDVVEHHLPSGDVTAKQNSQNLYDYRTKVIQRFIGQVHACIDSLNEHYENSEELHGSEVYRTVARNLNIFSKGGATTKILVLTSDLFECSNLLNVYHAVDHKLVEQSPEVVAKRFTDNIPIGKLSGVKVFIIHKSRDKNEDSFFQAMITVYKEIIESRGGSVYVQTNNENFYEY